MWITLRVCSLIYLRSMDFLIYDYDTCWCSMRWAFNYIDYLLKLFFCRQYNAFSWNTLQWLTLCSFPFKQLLNYFYGKIIQVKLNSAHIHTCYLIYQGRIHGGAHPARAPPKIGENMIFWRKIVIFQTKYPKCFSRSLRAYNMESSHYTCNHLPPFSKKIKLLYITFFVYWYYFLLTIECNSCQWQRCITTWLPDLRMDILLQKLLLCYETINIDTI